MNRCGKALVTLLASGFFSGYAPFAPGTFGTLAAVPLFLLLARIPLGWYVAATVLITLFAIWISGLAEKLYGRKDPSKVVIDEIAGFLVTMIAVPPAVLHIAAGFALFRLFDIIKPQPAGWINDNMRGGSGIVLDDVVAGIYANIVLQILYRMI